MGVLGAGNNWHGFTDYMDFVLVVEDVMLLLYCSYM